LQSNPEVAGCCGKIMYADARKTLWYAGARLNKFKLRVFHRGMLETDEGQYDDPEETLFITGCSMFVRSSIWRRIGAFDEKFFAYNEDIDWCLRAEKHKVKLWYLPQAVIYHKVSAVFGKTGGMQTPWVAPPIVVYLSERNQLFLLKKWKGLSGLLLLYFLKIPRFLKYSGGLLLLRRFGNLSAFCRGTFDGLFDLHAENVWLNR
jgi:GT2 family glycosyltransferase